MIDEIRAKAESIAVDALSFGWTVGTLTDALDVELRAVAQAAREEEREGCAAQLEALYKERKELADDGFDNVFLSGIRAAITALRSRSAQPEAGKGGGANG